MTRLLRNLSWVAKLLSSLSWVTRSLLSLSWVARLLWSLSWVAMRSRGGTPEFEPESPPEALHHGLGVHQ